MTLDTRWLPTGHVWDLHIMRMQDRDAGTFTGGGPKLCIHTTQSSWNSALAMENVLDRKDAAPHFVIGGRAGVKHPIVIQMVPLDRAARALGNDPSDGWQTNRANAVQIEVCAFAEDAQNMTDWQLKAIANLTELIRHRFEFPLKAPQDFSKPRRMGDDEWVKASGLVGHSMAPDNDHWDPGRFREGKLIQLVRDIPRGGGYNL